MLVCISNLQGRAVKRWWCIGTLFTAWPSWSHSSSASSARRVVPCVQIWEGKLEHVFLTIAPCLTYFLSRLYWTWHCCRWNKYYIRLNSSPITIALNNVFKEMPTTYWRALEHKTSLRAVVPPLQAPLDAGASTPSLPLPKEKDLLIWLRDYCQRQSFAEGTAKWALWSWKGIQQEEAMISA